MKSHCQEVAPAAAAPPGKKGKVTPKGKAQLPKAKVKSEAKAAASKPKSTKEKAAKAKAASKSKGRKSELPGTDEDEEQLEEADESERGEVALKRPAAFRRPSASPKQKSHRVSFEEDEKATKGKISNPYFYNNLNQWGIKVDGKQKVSVRCSDHWKE